MITANTQHIVNFSGGVCSFWAAKRVVDTHGPHNVTLLFADTLIEDEDLYRFNDDVAAHLGVPITRIADGRTPWEVFEQWGTHGFIGNHRVDICSQVLKRELLWSWIRANCLEFSTTVYLGMDWTEMHRLDGVRKRNDGWRIQAPMCEKPYWDKCKMLDELKSIGIEPPRLYRWGFPHNNCGGFCVKGGHAQFAKLLELIPERFAFHEAKENSMRETLGDVSILKDRRGGVTKPLPLSKLRERIEAGESFDRHDWGGCGCAVD